MPVLHCRLSLLPSRACATMDDEQFDIDDLVPPGVSEQTGADAELDTVLDQEVLDFLMSTNGAVDSAMDDKPPDLDLDEDDEFIFLDTPTDRDVESTDALWYSRAVATHETRGRKKGNRFLRHAIQEIDKSSDDMNQPEEIARGSIEYAPRCKEDRRRQERTLVAANESSSSGPLDPISKSLACCAKALGILRLKISFLQSCLLNACQHGLERLPTSVRQDCLCMKLVNTPAISNRGLSMLTDIDETVFPKESSETGSVFLESSNLLWAGMFEAILEGINSGQMKGLLIIRRVSYDETPLRSRVMFFDAGIQELVQDTSDLTKLMQSELTLQLVCQRCSVVLHRQTACSAASG